MVLVALQSGCNSTHPPSVLPKGVLGVMSRTWLDREGGNGLCLSVCLSSVSASLSLSLYLCACVPACLCVCLYLSLSLVCLCLPVFLSLTPFCPSNTNRLTDHYADIGVQDPRDGKLQDSTTTYGAHGPLHRESAWSGRGKGPKGFWVHSHPSFFLPLSLLQEDEGSLAAQ